MIFLLIISTFSGSSNKRKGHHEDPHDQVNYDNETEAKPQPEQVIYDSDGEAEAQPEQEDNDSVFQEALKQLEQMGFEGPRVRNILREANNDLNSALDTLYIPSPAFPQNNV